MPLIIGVAARRNGVETTVWVSVLKIIEIRGIEQRSKIIKHR